MYNLTEEMRGRATVCNWHTLKEITRNLISSFLPIGLKLSLNKLPVTGFYLTHCL